MISSVGRRARWLSLVWLGLPLGCAPAVLPAPAVSRRALASPGLAVAVPEAPLILPEPPRDDTEERVLPSGLRLVIDRDPTSHLVAVVTVVRAGASVEPAGKSGLAHLVEHLTFRAVDDDAPGGVPGADRWHRLLHLPTTAPVYATTSWDRMLFRSVAPSPTWHELLAIEAGRLARPLAGVGEPALEMERKWRTLGNYAARHDSPHDLARVLFNQWVQDLPFPLLDQQPAQIVAATPSDLTSLFAVCRDNATMVILGDRARVEEALADAWPLHPLAGVANR